MELTPAAARLCYLALTRLLEDCGTRKSNVEELIRKLESHYGTGLISPKKAAAMWAEVRNGVAGSSKLDPK